MGAARENYPDEKLGNQLFAVMPNLIIQLWANHSYTQDGMFKDDILESIQGMRHLLDQLEEEINKEKK